MPKELKEQAQKTLALSQRLRLILLVLGIILVLLAAIFKNLENKKVYLGYLKKDLEKIIKEARPLEEKEKGIKLIEARSLKKASSLEIIYALYQLMPASVSLVSLDYEEDRQLSLRGEALELNSLLGFVGTLEKASAFSGFNVKVRHATKKKIDDAETVDFEIVCLKNAKNTQ